MSSSIGDGAKNRWLLIDGHMYHLNLLGDGTWWYRPAKGPLRLLPTPGRDLAGLQEAVRFVKDAHVMKGNI
jgi:hypothetical protein